MPFSAFYDFVVGFACFSLKSKLMQILGCDVGIVSAP
jgi:hypothetical protein